MKIKIYHGSDKIITTPIFGYGKPNNDYGLGFYCTKQLDLAKEWSVDEKRDGFVNCYELEAFLDDTYDNNNTDKLNVMKFEGLKTGELKNLSLRKESDEQESHKKENGAKIKLNNNKVNRNNNTTSTSFNYVKRSNSKWTKRTSVIIDIALPKWKLR